MQFRCFLKCTHNCEYANRPISIRTNNIIPCRICELIESSADALTTWPTDDQCKTFSTSNAQRFLCGLNALTNPQKTTPRIQDAFMLGQEIGRRIALQCPSTAAVPSRLFSAIKELNPQWVIRTQRLREHVTTCKDASMENCHGLDEAARHMCVLSRLLS
jgi:hypothetical protein